MRRRPPRLFAEHIGIDYSGAGPPDAPCGGLRVYRAARGSTAIEVIAPEAAGRRGARRFSRHGLAEWLLARLGERGPAVVGIDHCFSFPSAFLARRGLASWDAFLDDFSARWPTERRTVASCRPVRPYLRELERLRLCERWTSSAKSVYQFGMNGQVATSSHAGIPWLRWLRARLGRAVHFWPFDGWEPPPGVHVVAEVYASLFRNRFPVGRKTIDQQDAFAIAEWLRIRDGLGALSAYFEPCLTREERRVAALEGWILGVL